MSDLEGRAADLLDRLKDCRQVEHDSIMPGLINVAQASQRSQLRTTAYRSAAKHIFCRMHLPSVRYLCWPLRPVVSSKYRRKPKLASLDEQSQALDFS